MTTSEMGEIWSPKTEPANTADRDRTVISGASVSQIVTTMGIKMPKVPQEVPVAKAKSPATIMAIAGRRDA